MDELVIGEKKYVSSKRAAKLTGYAKDYVGQLCREGRVPARLVGRSWYVLESAIQDHRFGDPKADTEEKTDRERSVDSTWESPRYESSDAEVLPSINRLQDGEKEKGEGISEISQNLQDSWRAWFDRIAATTPEPAVPSIPDVVPEKGEEDTEEPKIEETEKEGENEEVNIPVHAVYRRPPEELLPRYQPKIDVQNDEQEEERSQNTIGRRAVRAAQVTGTLVAFCMVVLAILGSGYLDSYILSNRQAELLAGVALYNK